METIDLNQYREPSELRKGLDYNLGAVTRIWELLEMRRIYPLDLAGKWVYSREENIKRCPGYFKEAYTVLVPIDRESYPRMYGKLYNPVSLQITTSLMDPEKPLYLSAMCISIDDAAFGTTNKTTSDYTKLCSIRDKFIKYLEDIEYLNITDFVEFGIKLGGTDASW